MSESWKNRLWSLLLVCTFAVVLSVCNKAMDSSSGGSKNSSGGIAFADFKPSDLSAVMYCGNDSWNTGVRTFKYSDSTDSTYIDSNNNYSLKLANLFSAGSRPLPVPRI